MLTKKEFIDEISTSLGDIRGRADCIDWWNSHLDAYLEDEIISKSAEKWTNPFLKLFKRK